MNCDLTQRVECLLNELGSISTFSMGESQTRRSEILEEILMLFALALEAQHSAISHAEQGRWV